MSDAEFSLFQELVQTLQETYPNQRLSFDWDIDRWVVSLKGAPKFTTSGYNFLYNATRLLALFSDELK